MHKQSFELYRNKFYRQLGDAQKIDHRVQKEKIRSFWNTMWNKTDQIKESNSFDDYLMNYLPDTGEQITFPHMRNSRILSNISQTGKQQGVTGSTTIS